MGVMNITPDSFSDGGNFLDHQEVLLDQVLTSGKQMVEDGARILDIEGSPVALAQNLLGMTRKCAG